MFCILLKGGGSLRRMDLNSSQRGGSAEIQSPPGFWSFFASPADLGGRHAMFAVLVCFIWLKKPRGPGTPRRRRPGRVPLGRRTGRTIGTPIRCFFLWVGKKRKSASAFPAPT